MVAWKPDPNVNDMQTVLIISEDAEMLSVWETHFDQRNFRVLVEASAFTGMETSRLLTPALVILDLDLSGEEPLNICGELRSTTNGTILLLGHGKSKTEISEFHRAGVDEYIPMPISPLALLIKCMTWLARQDWIVPRRQMTQWA